MRKKLLSVTVCLLTGAASAAGVEPPSPMEEVADRFTLALIVTYTLSAVWALAVLAMEALKRRALRPIDAAANAQALRAFPRRQKRPARARASFCSKSSALPAVPLP